MSDPVLLLHSGGMSSRQWGRLRAMLEPTHDILAPDFAGHGSTPVPADGTPVELSLDVDAMTDLVRADGRRLHVVGHSYGGLVALLVAARLPEQVLSLAVFEPVAFGVLHAAGDAEGLADLERLGNDPVFSDPAAAGTDPWLQRFVEYWTGEGAWHAMGERGQQSFRDSRTALAQGVASLMGDRTTAKDHARITAPTLVLSGERSPAAARRTARVLADAMPNARLQTIPGAGHMGLLTHADEVGGHVGEHLSSAA